MHRNPHDTLSITPRLEAQLHTLKSAAESQVKPHSGCFVLEQVSIFHD